MRSLRPVIRCYLGFLAVTAIAVVVAFGYSHWYQGHTMHHQDWQAAIIVLLIVALYVWHMIIDVLPISEKKHAKGRKTDRGVV